MSTKAKTFRKSDIQAAVWQETLDSPLVHEHTGEWIDAGKYQYQENILKDTATGLFYLFDLSRSGSYFTDFTYSFEWLKDEIELIEVRKATRTTTIWLAVEDK